MASLLRSALMRFRPSESRTGRSVHGVPLAISRHWGKHSDDFVEQVSARIAYIPKLYFNTSQASEAVYDLDEALPELYTAISTLLAPVAAPDVSIRPSQSQSSNPVAGSEDDFASVMGAFVSSNRWGAGRLVISVRRCQTASKWPVRDMLDAFASAIETALGSETTGTMSDPASSRIDHVGSRDICAESSAMAARRATDAPASETRGWGEASIASRRELNATRASNARKKRTGLQAESAAVRVRRPMKEYESAEYGSGIATNNHSSSSSSEEKRTNTRTVRWADDDDLPRGTMPFMSGGLGRRPDEDAASEVDTAGSSEEGQAHAPHGSVSSVGTKGKGLEPG